MGAGECGKVSDVKVGSTVILALGRIGTLDHGADPQVLGQNQLRTTKAVSPDLGSCVSGTGWTHHASVIHLSGTPTPRAGRSRRGHRSSWKVCRNGPLPPRHRPGEPAASSELLSPSLLKSTPIPRFAFGKHCLTTAVFPEVSEDRELDNELACSFEMFTVFLKARDMLVPKLIWGC